MNATGKSTKTRPPRKKSLQSVLVPSRKSWVTMALFMMSITKALAARLLFAIHGIVTVWRVASVKGSAAYYLMLMPVALMPGEMIFTLQTTDAGEWKWLCPSALLYLASVVPGLWVLQLDLYQKRIDFRDNMKLKECSAKIVYNHTSFTNLQGLQIPVILADDEWALALEQILLCLLILGRWLLPKGSLTREQLSQLLMVYIGMAADILEFSLENLREEPVVCNKSIIMIILAFWSWSLQQFAMVLTSVAGPKIRVFNKRQESRSDREDNAGSEPGESPPEHHVNHMDKGCCSSEIWALCISLIMQDGPYLGMRLYLIIRFHIINQMMLFFTLKNMMIFLLTVYRICVLHTSKGDKKLKVKVRVDPGDGLKGLILPLDIGLGVPQTIVLNGKRSKQIKPEVVQKNGNVKQDIEHTYVVAHVDERMRGKPMISDDQTEEIEL
ncbi:transmembrane protein 26-like [Asterias amurensis]|uniref:transmembrane protein 26-like n=1 Tax=Asterias amurensis TaxID=7602 RepID=UPI003AB77A5B